MAFYTQIVREIANTEAMEVEQKIRLMDEEQQQPAEEQRQTSPFQQHPKRRLWTLLIALFFAGILVAALISSLLFPFISGKSFMTLIPHPEDDLGFIDYMKLFPLAHCEHAFVRKENSRIEVCNKRFLNHLMKYVIMEPKVPVKENCNKPPPLETLDELSCFPYPNAFTGKARDAPAKLAHVVSMGFDVDALEIHLRQVYDLVDYFFIIEASRTHGGSTKKVMIWDHVRHQSRFKIFQDKVVLLALDDSDSLPFPKNVEPGKEFSLETHQEKRRWEMFLKWNEEHNNYFNDTDVIGFGHADQLPSRYNLQLLKHCETEGPIDIGAWFPLGLLNQAYATDFPLPGHRFTYGEPTFWPISMAKLHQPFPSNMKGKSGRFLLGGIHMSDIRYAPFIITKMHTCAECRPNPDLLRMLIDLLKRGDINEIELFFGDVRTKFLAPRIFNISDVQEEVECIVDVPWFLDCNRDRYPYWEKRHDTRL